MGSRSATGRSRLRAAHPRRLVVLCVAAVVVETIATWAWLPDGALGLAPQASAPTPVDLFHDLRWLVVYHDGWLAFAVELLVVLALRIAFTVAVVAAAWPAALQSAGGHRAHLRRVGGSLLIVALLLAPWVALAFALSIVSLSWLLVVALPVVFLVAVFAHGAVITDTWWRRTFSWRSVGWVALVFGATTVAGAVLTVVPPIARVPGAILAGLLNAWLWTGVADAVLVERAPRRAVPVAPIGLAAVVGAVVVSLVGAFAVAQPRRGLPYTPTRESSADWSPGRVASRPPLVVVTGFNTRWNGHPSHFVHLPYPQWRFSYRGMDDRGRPVAYRREDTHRSVRALARELADQVERYAAREKEDVTIVAESEGALIAKAYLAATPDAPVRALVMLSPLLDPGGVSYPPAGESGWGAAGRLGLAGLSWALGGLSPVEVSPDTPFLRSIVDAGPRFAGLAACSLPDVREASVLPLDTALGSPATARVPRPSEVVPGLHGGMVDDARTARIVAAITHSRAVPDDRGLWSFVERAARRAASVWRVPPLVSSLHDGWSDRPDPGDCRAVRADLARWLWD